jgi:hypothetical protein
VLYLCPEINNQKKMKIYPNPASGILNIRFSKTQRGFLFLFDLAGKCILKSSVNNQTHARILTKGMAAGVYILQVDGFYQKVFVH